MGAAIRWAAMLGLVALAIYCSFALLFTAGGRDLGGVGSALFIWFGALGSIVAVLGLVQKRRIGHWAGIAVYLVGAICFVVGAAVLKRPSGDRIFLLALGAINALGAFALCRTPIKGKD